MREEAIKELRTIKWLSFTTDIMSDDVTRVAFGGLTVHYIDVELRLRQLTLAFQRLSGHHTAESIGKWLNTVFNEFGIRDKVFAGVADGASAQQKALIQLDGKNLFVQH